MKTPPLTARARLFLLFAALVVVVFVASRHGRTALPLPLVMSETNLSTEPVTPVWPDPPALRARHNLIFWHQEKTASSATKHWLIAVARVANLRTRFFGSPKFFFSNPTDLAERMGTCNCTILGGHVHVRGAHDRPHEAGAGAVLATSRSSRDFLASKYFHYSEVRYTSLLSDVTNATSEAAWRMWGRFHMYDKCEAFRYYDGLPGCDLRPEMLAARAERIAARVDCVIDTDDAQRDADAVCTLMGLRDCPTFGVVNRSGRPEEGFGYEVLWKHAHIVEAMREAVAVVDVLRAAFMKRRCRFLTDGSQLAGRLTMGDLVAPAWPHCEAFQHDAKC